MIIKKKYEKFGLIDGKVAFEENVVLTGCTVAPGTV